MITIKELQKLRERVYERIAAAKKKKPKKKKLRKDQKAL